MSVEVRKEPKENVGGMLRRFTHKVRLSGILLSARKARFQKTKRSRNLRKKDALYREQIKKKRKRLDKLGLLK